MSSSSPASFWKARRARPAADSLDSGVLAKESAAAAAPEEPGDPSTRDTRERLPALLAPRSAESPRRPRRLAWADLLRRVFAIDVLRCPDCGGRLRILTALRPPEATEAILGCLGLPVRAPPTRRPPRRRPRGDCRSLGLRAGPRHSSARPDSLPTSHRSRPETDTNGRARWLPRGGRAPLRGARAGAARGGR